MDKKYTIAVAGTGDGDIIGTTKKQRKIKAFGACPRSRFQIFMQRGLENAKRLR